VWRDVFLASWLKYPHEKRPDLLASDVISKDFDASRQLLRVRRLIQIKGFIPSWLKFVRLSSPLASLVVSECALQLTSRGSVLYILEESETDVAQRRFAMRSTNITFSDAFRLDERCVYTLEAALDESRGTHFEQSAAAAAHIAWLGGRLEQYSVDTARNNMALVRPLPLPLLIAVRVCVTD